MHCLGAVTGGVPSPNGVGSRGGILSVFRALGVLVCEGRIQGPPRGYREGPHCAPPMQASKDHVCEEDNYLCNRYLVLIREITDRTAIGSFLCVEVLLCSDCPCGLSKATCKHPVCPVPSLSISSWQQTSEMLLEYWCICVVSNKGPETMNFQGLYQAVRSRLHFSQVAAWWSRSNGSDPRYIATRVVPHNEDNLRKFPEAPVEHTFPLAGNGDGTSIKVTVWALPRMEDVPVLSCPLHNVNETDEETVAGALTPTKAIPVASPTQNTENLVLPVLVDDRLQTPCNKPGKHHCRCEEEDSSPPSPSVSRPKGERKRRRSLPCGPADVNPCVTIQPMPLPAVWEAMPSPAVWEATLKEDFSQSSSYPKCSSELNSRGSRPLASQVQQIDESNIRSRNNLNSDNLERCFRTQLSIEEREGNVEKRYKRTVETFDGVESKSNVESDEKVRNGTSVNGTVESRPAEKNGLFENLIPFNSSLPWSFVESWNNSTANGKCGFQSLKASRDGQHGDTNSSVDPFRQSSSHREPSPNCSVYNVHSVCNVHQSCSKTRGKGSTEAVSPANEALESDIESSSNRGRSNRDLSHLMSKLSFPEEKEKSKEDSGFLDWFSKVPSRVLGVSPNNGYAKNKLKNTGLKHQEERGNEVKFKNCNLELSQREFDEVLAVLRARTPSERRRVPMRTVKRRERSEKLDDASEKHPTKLTNYENGEALPHYIVGRTKPSYDTYKSCRTNQQFSEKSGSYNQVYCKNIYPQPRDEKLNSNVAKDDLQGNTCNSAEKQTGNTADCLQNVSSKADVLLGAILRTSRERKGLSDFSNGTRPRVALPTAKNEANINSQGNTDIDKSNQDLKAQMEDEKSLPMSLNKRFNRFRQLFKKEQEKKEAEDSMYLPQGLNVANCTPGGLPNLHQAKYARESKAKRKIDFSTFTEENDKSEERLQSVSELSTNGAHQNTRTYSTNYQEESRGYENSCENGPELQTSQDYHSRLQSTKQDGKSKCEEGDDRSTASKTIKDPIPASANNFTPISLQNSSSSNRNNNLKGELSTEEDETLDKGVPSAIEQERFRRSLENAASMVFHSRTGLPLTSSPAPLRRGSCCFDYDSSLNSVSSKRSALFELNTPPSPGAVSLEETDREIENVGEGEEAPRRRSTSRHRPQSHALLGSFEESALNGRLEPVSTVHGFTAELGASGSFCPKHRKLPVTVFFYTLGDNDKVSTPYLAHINLGKKGYQVPRSGTIQVTLLNPLGTVVKMFVVLYDLSDMPPRSHTFLRQRTLRDKTLRYLVHLRFMSGKSGRIYLHTDIRMIICRKSDVDTASDFGSEPPKELRSYIHGPTNPKFSPRC